MRSLLLSRASRAAPRALPAARSLSASTGPTSPFLSPLFGLSESAAAVFSAAEAFAAAEIAPHAARWDAESHFPEEALRRAAAAGFATMWVSPDFGGGGMSRADSLPALEALAAACPSTAAFLSIHGMVAAMIDGAGSAEQKARYLPRLASMDLIASYCLTEPGAGSDAAALTTRAVLEPHGSAAGGPCYTLTGQKAFISGAGASGLYVVMARTGGAGPGGVSALLVDKDTPGLSFGANEVKMGWKCQPTRQVYFDGVRLPPSALLGREGGGFRMAMGALDGGRLSIGACSLGGADACLARALAHAATRQQFGRPLADNQAVAFALADMGMALFSARLALRAAAGAYDAGHPDARALCALAKAQATEKSLEVIDQALQLHGGYGYLSSTGVEKYLRDCRVRGPPCCARRAHAPARVASLPHHALSRTCNARRSPP